MADEKNRQVYKSTGIETRECESGLNQDSVDIRCNITTHGTNIERVVSLAAPHLFGVFIQLEKFRAQV